MAAQTTRSPVAYEPEFDEEPEPAEIIPFRQRPRSHVLLRPKSGGSGRLAIDEGVEVPDLGITFYTAR